MYGVKPATNAACNSINAAIGVRTWRYLFRGIFPSYRLYEWLRAYHAQDAFLFWGYRPRGIDVPLRPVERAAMAYLQNAWAAFVVDPVDGLTEFGWPRYQANSESILVPSLTPSLTLSLYPTALHPTSLGCVR